MLKVENEALIARLNAMYKKSREGKVLRGSELKEKEWFFDETDRSFKLVNCDNLLLWVIH